MLGLPALLLNVLAWLDGSADSTHYTLLFIGAVACALARVPICDGVHRDHIHPRRGGELVLTRHYSSNRASHQPRSIQNAKLRARRGAALPAARMAMAALHESGVHSLGFAPQAFAATVRLWKAVLLMRIAADKRTCENSSGRIDSSGCATGNGVLRRSNSIGCDFRCACCRSAARRCNWTCPGSQRSRSV